MKKGFVLLGLFCALSAMVGQAQIYQMFSQNFEAGSPVNYTVSSSTEVHTQSSLYSEGSSALFMHNTSASDMTVILDTVDFSSIATFAFYTLEFSHIAFVNPVQVASAYDVCNVWVKRPEQTQWTQLTSSHYNMSDGGSTEFARTSTFNTRSYHADWYGQTNPSNMMWKSERFDLDQVFLGVAPTSRQLIVRFEMKQRNTSAGASATAGWYIDDIKMRASSQQIVTPKISLLSFPDALNYPNSRGARVEAKVSTMAIQGINSDSVFVEYTVGNSTVPQRVYMQRQGNSDLFVGRMPFYGYDTLIHYHVVAIDSTLNNNTAYYPKSAAARITYRCVRGKTNSGYLDNSTGTNSSAYPFSYFADTRSECIYDSTEMAQCGFKPGAITSIRYQLGSSPRRVERQRLQIRMANVDNSYQRTAQMEGFLSTPMQIVYDSVFVIDQAAANSIKTINLQDTFFYAGSTVVVQFVYHNPDDLQATPVKHITTSSTKQSLYMSNFEASMNQNFFGGNEDQFTLGIPWTTKPWLRFFAQQNVPLMTDCGVSAMAYPTYMQASHTGIDSVVVWLKNYGVYTMNAVRMAYSIDNASPVYYNWTGSLAAGDSVRVLLSSTQNFTAGYHTIRAWVDDTVTIDTLRLRDHEPYNDTFYTPFVSCAGPYSGEVSVGTPGAPFATLDRCLYVLSCCGVDGPLRVKLAPGVYGPTKFPFIPGASLQNYVIFEPASGQVTFRRPRQGANANITTLVDLSETKGVRFRNIHFSDGLYQDNRCDVLVRLGQGSSNCQFLNCSFADSIDVDYSTLLPADALLSTGYADSTLVEGCTFYGGTIGIEVVGAAPDIRAKDNMIRFNNLKNQMSTAISVTNQNHVVVDSNMLDDVRTNASYLLLCQYVYDSSRIVRNRIYSSKGASCIGVSDMYGSANAYSYVANNMLVSLDDGTTNQLTTPLNIIKGAYLRVAFNSVRMSAPSRVNIAAATLGGGVVNNCYFQNNVVATFDSTNFAFAYIPATAEAVNYVDHNCYYATSGILNKMSGVNYSNLNNWQMAFPTDVGSVSGNPIYTNAPEYRVDLRSFNELLRHVGVPIPGITNDIFDSVRDANHPSLGAFEVAALQYDFTPVEFITPAAINCGGVSAEPVEVCIRNTGTATYQPSSTHPVNVSYSVNGGPVQTFVMNRSVGAGDTVHFLSTRTLTLPYGPGNTDSSYTIRWWVKCNLDPDNINDTTVHTVLSRFAAPAPNPITMSVGYSTQATITPTQGILSWPVSYYTSGNGRQQKSGISWYHSLEDEEPFHYGNTYVTETMYASDTLYISQKRNLPLVKITEVQVSRANNAAGVTYPMPSYVNVQTNFAVELTNCGDYPANLEGDTIMIIRCNVNTNFWVLPNVTIQPGANLILQFKTNATPSDSSRTIYAPSTAVASLPAYNHDFAVIYRDGHGVADAVPFNNVITATSNKPEKWSNQGIPAAVWQGAAISMGTSAVAGASRISWPTNARNAGPTATATLWRVSSNENRMRLGTTEQNLIQYYDNGCEGFRGPVYLNVTNAPSVDIAVDAPVVDTGCNLSTAEPVSVTIHNYGQSNSTAVVVKYSLDGGTTVACADTIAAGLAAHTSLNHTFSTPMNMHMADDTMFHVLVWLEATPGDSYRLNDTSSGSFLSRYSPEPPVVTSPQEVQYAHTLTLVNTAAVPTAVTVWSDRNHVILDTTDESYETTPLYTNDTFYVRTVAQMENPYHVGTLASNTNNNFPSPYNPKMRYVKEQYLVTADQLRAAGHSAGKLASLSFYLSSVANNTGTFTFSDYTIKIGTTELSVFPNGTFQTDLTQVYQSSNLSLSSANTGWVKHVLDTMYNWDGVSNLVIQVTRTLSTAGITSGANTAYTAQANTVITSSHNTNPVEGNASGTKGNNRPDILFGFMDVMECSSPEQPIVVNVVGTPDVDAAISWPTEAGSMVVSSCDTTQHFYVKVTNYGSNPLYDYTLHYQIDNGTWQQVTGNAGGITILQSIVAPLVNTHLAPGRHVIRAVIAVTGDTIDNNDTIARLVPIRFCAGTYTVGATTGNDYATLSEVVDTLMAVGIAGPVVFSLDAQTFENQVMLGEFYGATGTNTVTFMTNPSATTQAEIRFQPTQAANFVLKLDNARNLIFNNLKLYAYDPVATGNVNNKYTSVVSVSNAYNVQFRYCTIRSKFRASANQKLVQLGENNVYLTIDHCTLDSGYYAIFARPQAGGHHLTVTRNHILNFGFRGIDIRNIDTVNISSDSIASIMAENSKPLTGITVSCANNLAVKKNFIHFHDGMSGGKRGIQLFNCHGTNVDRVTVYNNMINLRGSQTASQQSAGIFIDSTSSFVSVYFNTVRLYAGVKQMQTKAFSVQGSSHTFVLNNIFSNFSQGYAYYVAIDSCVDLSDYNIYWSNTIDTNNIELAFWGVNCPTFDSLKRVNNSSFELHSFEDEPIFNSEYDLRMRLAQYSGLAQYNADVPDDVFDSIRPQIPTPTIGAHEFLRPFHDIAIAKIVDPMMPATTTGTNAIVYNIETDSIMVRVRFYNNGSAPEPNCYWYCNLDGVTPAVQSPNRSISLPLRQFVEDSVKLYSPLGVQDTQRVVVHLELVGAVDSDPSNNVDTQYFFIYPAYDLQVTSIAISDSIPGSNPRGCRLFQVPIEYTVKNIGKKDFPGDFTFELGYDAYQFSPATSVTVIPTLPTTNTEIVSFGSGNDLPVGTDRVVVISPNVQPNFYPTGYIGDITVKVRGWVHYQHDIKNATDTSNYISVASYHTPVSPAGHDTMVDYGTYANLFATQSDSRTIRWHNDTSGTGFYYNGNNQYARSTHWESRTTDPWVPPYIHDTVFWLSCLSTRNCTSYYSPIHVSINIPLMYDVSISQVTSPRSPLRNNPRPGRVYNEVDTVVLRVVNYGSSPISNIPIGFKFMNANGRTTYLEAYDTVRTTIPGRVGDNVHYYDFKFPDSVMLQLQGSPLTRTAYTLNAWVNHIDDQQHNNDTISKIYDFATVPENTYDTIKNHASENPYGFDITRVSFNTLDHEMPEMIGYTHIFFGNYNAANAEVPTLFMRKGTTDTLTVEIANNADESDTSTLANVYVAIDYNRDGIYGHRFDGTEVVAKDHWGEILTKSTETDGTVRNYCTPVASRHKLQIPLTIPEHCQYGYMRMMVMVNADTSTITLPFPYKLGSTPTSTMTSYNLTNGCIYEFLLFVQEPGTEVDTDAALTRVVSPRPRNRVLDDSIYNVSVMLANKGNTVLTETSIKAIFNNQAYPSQVRNFNWVGQLEPGHSTMITFDSIFFYPGTTNVLVTASTPGDTVNTANDTLRYQYHRYHVIEVRFIDSFDVSLNMWYTPMGFNAYTRNLFTRETPQKSNLPGPLSEPRTYVTDASQTIVTGKRGNRSVLYSPIIYRANLKPDTLTFYLAKDLAYYHDESYQSSLTLEFLDYEGKWQTLDDFYAGRDTASWYDDADGTIWKGSSNGEYVMYRISTKPWQNDMPQNLQFRFVYRTPTTPYPNASFGDGVAIDNWYLDRGQLPLDIRVTDILYPVAPRFGETIQPRIRLHNNGYQPAHGFRVAYRTFGIYLPIEATFSDTVQPGDYAEFTFPYAFTITNNFPDTFSICSFPEITADVYRDNDTACKEFGLAPLQHDMYMYGIQSPLDHAVAGDSIYVTVRLRNFGQSPVNNCSVTYVFNGIDTVTEAVDFSEYLGHPLGSTEFFSYSFRKRIKASVGVMEVTTWVDYDMDSYRLNDTLTKQIRGVNSVADVQANSIIIYDGSDGKYHVGLVMDNMGARMANNFKVGFWYDNDSVEKKFEETFYRVGGLPSGGHTVHEFSQLIEHRQAEILYATGYCVVPGDQDRSNDTTSNLIVGGGVDITPLQIEVEENNTDSCRVRIQLTNVGTMPSISSFRIEATINGKTLRSFTNDRIYPGEPHYVMFDKKILKSDTRTYKGYGGHSYNDIDTSNNRTNVIRVVNYFEGIAPVEEEGFELSQNYPNPFDGSTRIEFSIPAAGKVRFVVTDALGRQVYNQLQEYSQGRNTIVFSADQFPAGIYYYTVIYNGERRMKKMIVR